MPKRDASYMDGQRKRIVVAAYRCFRRDGIHQSSMADICAEAKLSMGAIYGHFASKEEILFGVFDHVWEEYRRKTTIECWADFDREYLQRALKPQRRDDLRMSFEMMALATVDATIARLQKTYALQADEYLEQTLERLSAAGEIEPPTGIAYAMRILRLLLAGTYLLANSVGGEPNRRITLEELRGLVQPILQPRVDGSRRNGRAVRASGKSVKRRALPAEGPRVPTAST
jgi:AcrR family transcriptional regulator